MGIALLVFTPLDALRLLLLKHTETAIVLEVRDRESTEVFTSRKYVSTRPPPHRALSVSFLRRL